MGLPSWQNGKESACQCRRLAGDAVSIPWSGRSPGEGNGSHSSVVGFFFLPGKSHGQRSLAGYSSWDSKESDTLVYYNAIISYIFLYTMVGCEKTGIDTVFVLNFFSS